jgi:predicted O-methyltransferase YrrM
MAKNDSSALTGTRAAVAGDSGSQNRVQEMVHAVDRAAWVAAALALALREGGPDHRHTAAERVLAALDIGSDADLAGLDRRAVAAQAAAPLLQTATLVADGGPLWADQTDASLVAQGRASAQGARAFAQLGLPHMPGLARAMAAPGARMLDVGTGVAALAVAYAERFANLTVVGIDVLPRVLALAEETVRSSGVADRIVLRQQDVSTLEDLDAYVLAFLPAPFIPETALRAGVARVARALTPGGWLMLAHGKLAEDSVDDALTRFKTVVYGGTALDSHQARTLLTEADLTNVMSLPTPLGAPGITLGQRITPA